MKLGIMQPYFFPYIGYFQLINAVDRWIVFDVVQYIRHQWVNRNRILHPNQGWQYIVVPITSHARGDLIKDIRIVPSRWREKIVAQLAHYKMKAPYYMKTLEFVKHCLFDVVDCQESLALLNQALLYETCQYISVPYHSTVCSDLDLDFSQVTQPGDWALTISRQLGATEYVNPIGGLEIFKPEAFQDANVRLSFLSPRFGAYSQKGYDLQPGLSIIDVLMWNSMEDVKMMLKEFDLVSSEEAHEGLV